MSTDTPRTDQLSRDLDATASANANLIVERDELQRELATNASLLAAQCNRAMELEARALKAERELAEAREMLSAVATRHDVLARTVVDVQRELDEARAALEDCVSQLRLVEDGKPVGWFDWERWREALGKEET